MQLEGSVAIITGGASGLGAATARRLVAGGAKVVLADLNSEKGEALATELGEGALYHPVNVTSEDDVEAAIEAASGLGTLRIAVNCAGIGAMNRTIGRDGSAHPLETYRQVVDVNLVGTFNVLSKAASAMSKADPMAHGERGVVINTASVAAFDGQIGQIAYASSKAAIVGMTLPAARDLSVVGVRVMTIAPGTFDTPMIGMLPDSIREVLAAGIPFPKELGQPDQYASLVEQIVTNSYLNGEVIRLDGALRMPPK